MVQKTGFVFQAGIQEAIRNMPPEERLEAYEAVCDYGLYGIERENLSPTVRILMCVAETYLDKSRQKYAAAVENGKKGGRPSKASKTAEETPAENPVENPAENPAENLNKNKTENKTENMTMNKNKTENERKKENGNTLLSSSPEEITASCDPEFPHVRLTKAQWDHIQTIWPSRWRLYAFRVNCDIKSGTCRGEDSYAGILKYADADDVPRFYEED